MSTTSYMRNTRARGPHIRVSALSGVRHAMCSLSRVVCAASGPSPAVHATRGAFLVCELRLRERMPCAAVLRLVGSYPVRSDRPDWPRTRWYTYIVPVYRSSYIGESRYIVTCLLCLVRARARVRTCKYSCERKSSSFLATCQQTRIHVGFFTSWM